LKGQTSTKYGEVKVHMKRVCLYVHEGMDLVSLREFEFILVKK